MNLLRETRKWPDSRSPFYALWVRRGLDCALPIDRRAGTESCRATAAGTGAGGFLLQTGGERVA